MSQLFQRSRESGVWLTLASENNTLNLDLIEEIRELLRVHERSEAPLIVLMGEDKKFFSPGFDLREVVGFSRGQMAALVESFLALTLELFSFRKPTIAHLNGHAIAGGCLLASSCDFRLASVNCRIGMTPLSRLVSIPFRNLCMLQSLLGPRIARDVAYYGKNYEAEQARALGWIDIVAEPSRLMEETEELAETLTGGNREALFTAKKARITPVLNEIESGLEMEIVRFLDCWFAPESQTRLREEVKRLNLE